MRNRRFKQTARVLVSKADINRLDRKFYYLGSLLLLNTKYTAKSGSSSSKEAYRVYASSDFTMVPSSLKLNYSGGNKFQRQPELL